MQGDGHEEARDGSPDDQVAVRVFGRPLTLTEKTNLEKQGVLPLTFKDPRDYDRIDPHTMAKPGKDNR